MSAQIADQTRVLWTRFKRDGCQIARARIILEHYHLASITAGRLFGPVPSGVEREDLVGAGVTGLIKAVDQFDSARGIKFETYAITLIRGAILEALRKDDWVPRLIRDQQKALKAAYIRLEERHGRAATHEEVARELGVEAHDLDKILANVGRCNLLSLDDLRIGSDQLCIADMLASDEPSPFECLLVKERLQERNRLLSEGLTRLPERERVVVGLYYRRGLTFKRIGEILEVSESRAYQLHAQAIVRLRNFLEVDAEVITCLDQ